MVFKIINGQLLFRRRYFSQAPHFGILFDIDGVIVRGSSVLPSAPTAFSKLVDDSSKKFRVPVVFVTNAGNSLRLTKAKALSSWLNVHIAESQVVMAHSPLKTLSDLHSKRILISGQGPVFEIAQHCGFTNVIDINGLSNAFPRLDAVDQLRRKSAPCAFESYNPRIEAIVCFGEPIYWERSLQLLLDALLTNGLPDKTPSHFHYPHLPLFACNMDLQWMSEAVLPRFGHGAFLLCLENLYKKITGFDLIYSGLFGKPSEITYSYSENLLQEQGTALGGTTTPLRNIYCIGDNVCTDIFGANLYQSTVSKRISKNLSSSLGESKEKSKGGAENIISILVETGVYSKNSILSSSFSLSHSPRDFLPTQTSYQEPTHVVSNVDEAVDLIFSLENFV